MIKRRQINWVYRFLYHVTFCFCVKSVLSSKVNDIDKPIPVSVINTVPGYTARFECDLNSNRPDDSAYLVLWYIESEKQPIYSVDLRARPLEQAKHWKSERFSRRAHFNTSQPAVAALLLANVTDQDTGVYKCRVDFRQSPTRQMRYQLNVVSLPKLPIVYANGIQLIGLEAGPYDEGAELTLICEVASDTASTSAGWYRNGQPVASTVEHRVHHSYYQLRINSLSRAENRAEFACVLKLDIQPRIPPVAQNFTLNVRSRPSSVEILKSDAIFEASKERQLHCRAAGSNPPAIITWWIGNRQLTDVGISVADGVNGTVSHLTFIPTIDDDGRIITCRAQTPHLSGGFVEDSIRLQVFYAPKINLVLGQRFTPEEIYEGSDIYLECQTRSNPPIHRLAWMHNGKPVNKANDQNVYISNQSLVIRQISRYSSGNYTCIAVNRVAETESLALELNVKYAPVCKHLKAVTVIVSQDDSVTLSCQVDADPGKVDFRWTLSTNRETALVPREVPVDSGLSSILEYTPRRDSDFGQLQCWAMNTIGKQKEPCIFNLIKEGLPTTPKHCVMQRFMRTALEVRCNNVTHSRGNSDESEVISGSSNVYWLQLYNAETGVLLRNVSNRAAPWFNITGIELTTRVAAVITAVNKQGKSDSVTLEGALERAVGSRSVNDPQSTESFVILIAAPGALLIVIIGLAAVLAIYQRHYKRSLRNQSVQSANQTVVEHHNQELNKVSIQTRSSKPPGAIRSKQGHLDENWHQSLVTIAGSSNEEVFNQDSDFGHPAARQTAIDRDPSSLPNPPCKPGILKLHQPQQTVNLQVRQRPAGIHYEQTKRIYHER